MKPIFKIDPDLCPMKKCPKCDGQGTWVDRTNKCSYGVPQEDVNIVERCSLCHGRGYVDNIRQHG